MTTVPSTVDHPHWCDLGRCEVGLSGPHLSEATKVTGSRRELRMLIMLTQVGRRPVRLRLVVVGNDLINTLHVDLDTGHLMAAALLKVIGQAQRPEDDGTE